MPSKKTAGQGTKAKPLVIHLAGGFAMSGIRGIGTHRTGKLHYRGPKIVRAAKLIHSAPRKVGLKQG
jgi:hypothetical protein